MLKYVVLIIFILSNQSSNDICCKKFYQLKSSLKFKKKIPAKSEYSKFEIELLKKGYIDIKKFIPDLKVDLRYTTKNNFTKNILYKSISHAFLHKDAAIKLKNAQKLLKQTDVSLGLIVFDALRPQNIQYKMWEYVKNTPAEYYLGDPKKGSIHNYGCAVDVSIIKNGRKILDMGSTYDFFGILAEYNHNKKLLNENILTKNQVDNRKLLRKIMLKADFYPINSEWWHFNAYKTFYVRKKYPIIK